MNTDVKQVFNGDEISLKELVLIFWERRRIFVIWMIVLGSIGILANLLESKDQYVASTLVVSEIQSTQPSGKKGLSALAELTGLSVDRDQQGGLSSPEIYPMVAGSELFLVRLMEEKFYFEMYEKELSLIDFFLNYEDRSIVDLWVEDLKNLKMPKLSYARNKLVSAPRDGFNQENYQPDLKYGTITLNGAQKRAIAKLKNAVEVNPRGSFVRISVTMPERMVSAQLTEVFLHKLMDYVVELQTKKEVENLDFVKKRTAIAKKNFEAIQRKLAEYEDANRGVISSRANIERENLQREANIAAQMYGQLATQMEQMELALQEQKPVYSVFRPTIVPDAPEAGGSTMLFIGFIFLGFVIGGVQVVLIIIRKLIE